MNFDNDDDLMEFGSAVLKALPAFAKMIHYRLVSDDQDSLDNIAEALDGVSPSHVFSLAAILFGGTAMSVPLMHQTEDGEIEAVGSFDDRLEIILKLAVEAASEATTNAVREGLTDGGV